MTAPSSVELCDWDPTYGVPAEQELNLDGSVKAHHGCTNVATVSVGGRQNWHLCESCAALPRFRRFTKRVPLRSAEP